MLLVANRMPVRACRGDGDEERLCSGIARAIRQNIPEFPVRLGVPNLGNRFSHKIDDADTPKENRNLIIS